VPVDAGQWIRQGSGECTSAAAVLHPLRLVYMGPSLSAAELSIDHALDAQQGTAMALIVVGAVGSFFVAVAIAYACYWQAMHTCANTMFGRNSARRRAQRRRWYKGGRGGDSASDESDESDEPHGVLGVYIVDDDVHEDEDDDDDARDDDDDDYARDKFGTPYRARARRRSGKHGSGRNQTQNR
jgi:hypothetical protein